MEKGKGGGEGLGKVYICCLVLLNSLQMAGIGYGPCTLKIYPAAMKKRFKKNTHTGNLTCFCFTQDRYFKLEYLYMVHN